MLAAMPSLTIHQIIESHWRLAGADSRKNSLTCANIHFETTSNGNSFFTLLSMEDAMKMEHFQIILDGLISLHLSTSRYLLRAF